MLNELFTIYRGLESVGEVPQVKHNDIQQPGLNNVTFRVMLDEYGRVETVKLMRKDQIQECWSWGNNQTQFPAIKVQLPLLPEANEDYLKWKNEKKRANEKEYRSLIECMSHLYLTPINHIEVWPKYRKSILERTKKLKEIEDCEEVHELLNRYSQTATGVEILDQVTRHVIVSALQNANLASLKAISALLFGEKLKRTGEIADTKRITLFLDCRPRTDIDTLASSRKYVPALSRALFTLEAKTKKKGNDGLCALSGKTSHLVGDTFPEEKLAVVGPTILFAKNEGTSGRTVERYGQARGKAFPVSVELSRKLAAGISFLTAEKYRNKTWANLPSSGLLLAYCREDYDLPITTLVTGESEVDDFEDYLDAAESVLASFRAKDLSLDALVDFLEIIKVDKANRKINYSSSTRIGQLVQAVGEWRKACKNTPDFKLFAQILKNKRLYAPWSVSPQQVMAFSQKKYIRSGKETTSLPGITFSDAMKLFFDKQRSVWLKEFLRSVTNQYLPLFRYCALSRVQNVLPNKNITVKTSPKHNAQALSAVTMIAVLLYKTGRTKEVYMDDFAFVLGQLCSAMDEVHIGYCVSERSGSIPNTLLGNQVYGMALQDPVKAMAFMAARRRPYDSWVKRIKYQKDKNLDKAIRNATYAQYWMGRQAEKLNQYLQKSGPATSNSYKSELMLGYLAGRPFEQKKNDEKSNNDIGETK
jgi:hypothetical protein